MCSITFLQRLQHHRNLYSANCALQLYPHANLSLPAGACSRTEDHIDELTPKPSQSC
jgi:hypothetical protein